MTLKEAYLYGVEKIKGLYGKSEAESILKLVLENITKTEKTDPFCLLANAERSRFYQILGELQTSKPVQYILNEAWFCEMRFYVNKDVLIPRPETEELVEWIISNIKFPVQKLKILDIGSGSGCIPVSLKRKVYKAEVWSCDISSDALTVARRNAEALGAAINFLHIDFLNANERTNLPVFDIIVSNPPYIPEKDKNKIHSNVLNYEPHTALFVPDNDALIFYKAIADFGKMHLTPTGSIFLEIHEDYGTSVKNLFLSAGYLSAEIKKDMQEKERMIRIESGVNSK
jgi:release factor glutamine methyltransferase